MSPLKYWGTTKEVIGNILQTLDQTDAIKLREMAKTWDYEPFKELQN